MAMTMAMPKLIDALRGRVSIPRRVPPFNTPVYRVFSFVWIAAFILAALGPVMGIYMRYSTPDNNSQLILGSHAGIAVTDRDVTRIRFPVGPETKAAGIEPGDDIIAIYGMEVPDVVNLSPRSVAENADDPAIIMFQNLLLSPDSAEVPVTVRSPSGEVREVIIRTGEQHIDAAARSLGVSPGLLNFIDLVHVIFYPFLLWAAWILHRRNARDAVSSILSLAILLTIGAEQPSIAFLFSQGVSRAAAVNLFDLANVFLLAGILLFPHGMLTPRRIILLAMLPGLMMLSGDTYKYAWAAFMIVSVLILLRSLRRTARGDVRQQIKWALFGFTGYALFRGLSQAGDMFKTSMDSIGAQFLMEIGAGLALALAMLLLQLGLLVALLRFRLYDAESIISRTASVAIVTVMLGGLFAGLMEGIITQMQAIYPDSETPAAMVGAILAAVLIGPLHGRVQHWAERRFHKNLLALKDKLPEAMRDLRDVASVPDFLQEIMGRVSAAVLAQRAAVVIGREVTETSGVTKPEVLRWLLAFSPPEGQDQVHCDHDDTLFPLRVRIADGSGTFLGWLLIGPRPDGSIAGQDEREALADIAIPFARSLRIVLNREQEKQELMQLLDAHRQRIERIEASLLA